MTVTHAFGATKRATCRIPNPTTRRLPTRTPVYSRTRGVDTDTDTDTDKDTCTGEACLAPTDSETVSDTGNYSGYASPFDIDMIVNGGFTHEAAYWHLTAANVAAASFYTQDQRMIVAASNGGSQPSDLQLWQTGFNLKTDHTYRLEFDGNASGAVTIQIAVSQIETPFTDYAPAVAVTLQAEEAHFYFDFVMTGEFDDNVRLIFNLGGSTETIRLDDVTMTILYFPEQAEATPPEILNPGNFIYVTPCVPAADADEAVITDIRTAVHEFWMQSSTHSSDIQVSAWAHRYFESEDDFATFVINWANVETGGHFNRWHENWSLGNTERNVGILQINQTWAVRHDTWDWHDSNPHDYAAEDAFDPQTCVDWALHHLIGLGRSAEWNLTKMLDSYWQGTFNDSSPYAEGIYNGVIIDYPE